MSLKEGGKTSEMETARRSINEQLLSVGEEILTILEREIGVDCVKLVRVFVLERLSLAAETLETLLERRNNPLDTTLQPHATLHRAGE